ncbi:MAG: leucine-rich repeat protein, partial [archaeon]|nr:leucine-rich repeat protein [archaeon]
SHNLISRIDPLLLPTAPQQLPALSTIDLSHNRISDLQELAFLSSLPALRHLSLHANPLTALPQYRIRAIALLPRIKWLDFRKVTAAEKKAAVSLAKDSSSISSSSSTSSSSSSSSTSSSSSSAGRLSDKQKDLLRQAITRASSLEQIMALEAAASAGILEQEVTRLGL